MTRTMKPCAKKQIFCPKGGFSKKFVEHHLASRSCISWNFSKSRKILLVVRSNCLSNLILSVGEKTKKLTYDCNLFIDFLYTLYCR